MARSGSGASRCGLHRASDAASRPFSLAPAELLYFNSLLSDAESVHARRNALPSSKKRVPKQGQRLSQRLSLSYVWRWERPHRQRHRFHNRLRAFYRGRLRLGQIKERRRFGRNLEDDDFYPCAVNRDNLPEFSLKDLRLGMHYFLRNFDPMAARQLIFIGEQNNVRSNSNHSSRRFKIDFSPATTAIALPTTPRNTWKTSRASCGCSGNHSRTSASKFSSTISRILPRSLVALENNVTGRNLKDGTTSLVTDLKKRQLLHEDKVNDAIELGVRRFKCATIPIIRPEDGVAGAICINVDANYLAQEGLSSAEKVTGFFKPFAGPICKSTRTSSAATNSLRPSKASATSKTKASRIWREAA